eukprot:3147279-Rhodomonas_salina.2
MASRIHSPATLSVLQLAGLAKISTGSGSTPFSTAQPAAHTGFNDTTPLNVTHSPLSLAPLNPD